MEVEAGGVTVNSQAKRKPPASLQRGQELNKFSKEKQDERYLGDQTVRRFEQRPERSQEVPRPVLLPEV